MNFIEGFGALKRAISPEIQPKTYRVGDLINTLDDSKASKEEKQKAVRLINKVLKESN